MQILMSMYYGPGPLESFLSFVLFVWIIGYFISTKKNKEIRKQEQIKPVDYQKDVLGQDIPILPSNSDTYKPLNNFNVRVAFSVIILLILLVSFFNNHPEITLINKGATYYYIDPTYDYTKPTYVGYYDTAHFNLERSHANFYETYSGIYSWNWNYVRLYETPKYRKRVLYNSSKKEYYNPLWNLH